MKGEVKLVDTGEKRIKSAAAVLIDKNEIFDELIKEEWLKSPERKEAWLKFTARQFDQSQEFANARHAFRKRING